MRSSGPVLLRLLAGTLLALALSACATGPAGVGGVAPTYGDGQTADPAGNEGVGRPYAADGQTPDTTGVGGIAPTYHGQTTDPAGNEGVGRPYAADGQTPDTTGVGGVAPTYGDGQTADPAGNEGVGRPYAADGQTSDTTGVGGVAPTYGDGQTTDPAGNELGRPYAADGQTSDTTGVGDVAPTYGEGIQPSATHGEVGDGAGDEEGPGPTQAELDYAAIYGEEVYDPVADPSLPPPAHAPTSYDPWEPFNRRVHRFNNAVDRNVALPLARAYVNAVPRPVRLGVSNFFSNLGQPVSAVNALLQGKPKQAAQSLGRFVMNFTLGIGGIFDPASDANIPHRSEDFGQTLGVWGWENSRYLELPLFGPRTLRDAFGLVGDAPLSPTRQVDDDAARIGLQGLQLVDIRTQLMAVDRMREGAADEYALVRDAWLQRRNYQIHGDRTQDDDYLLPDYLLDDEANPTVPADAMPVPIPDM